MAKSVEDVQIFHITHIDNLPAIIADGCLWSDYQVSQRNPEHTVIGYETIKKRRLLDCRVSCHPATFVGHFVPFYFCPRSPMLYIIGRRNSGLRYRGGQERIVHLESTIGVALQSCPSQRWAFSDGNASTWYTQFSNDLDQFNQYIDWNAVRANDWRDSAIENRKQAEFLIHESFPWTAVRRIAAIRQEIASEVQQILANVDHQPQVVSKPEWYYPE